MDKYKYFSEKELACQCGCGLGQEDMNFDFMDRLIWIRSKSGIVMPLSSGIRCPTHNKLVSSTGLDGPHTTGHAVDILIYGSPAFTLIEWGIKAEMSGIGIAQKGLKEKRFIHFDDLLNLTNPPRPWVWSY